MCVCVVLAWLLPVLETSPFYASMTARGGFSLFAADPVAKNGRAAWSPNTETSCGNAGCWQDRPVPASYGANGMGGSTLGEPGWWVREAARTVAMCKHPDHHNVQPRPDGSLGAKGLGTAMRWLEVKIPANAMQLGRVALCVMNPKVGLGWGKGRLDVGHQNAGGGNGAVDYTARFHGKGLEGVNAKYIHTMKDIKVRVKNKSGQTYYTSYRSINLPTASLRVLALSPTHTHKRVTRRNPPPSRSLSLSLS